MCSLQGHNRDSYREIGLNHPHVDQEKGSKATSGENSGHEGPGASQREYRLHNTKALLCCYRLQ